MAGNVFTLIVSTTHEWERKQRNRFSFILDSNWKHSIKKDLRKNYESAFAGLVEKIELGFFKSFSLRGFGNPGSNTEEFNVFPVPNNVYDLKIGNGR